MTKERNTGFWLCRPKGLDRQLRSTDLQGKRIPLIKKNGTTHAGYFRTKRKKENNKE